MINKICTLLLAAFLFTSCSSDDAPAEDPIATPEVPVTPTEPVVITDPVTPVITPNPSLTLPKSYRYDLMHNGSAVLVNGATYKINGDKLVECGDGVAYQQKYTYTGDLITKIEMWANTTLAHIYEFTYENNKPKSYTIEYVMFAEFAYKIQYTYTHNNDGTVSYERKLLSGKYQNGDEDGKGTLTIVNGNITRDDFVETLTNAQHSKKESLVYEYDTKNTFCKNIKGLNLLYFLQNNPLIGNQCSANNMTSKSGLEEIYNLDGSIRTPSRVIYKTLFSYEYNADNYPTKVTDVTGDNTTVGPTTFAY